MKLNMYELVKNSGPDEQILCINKDRFYLDELKKNSTKKDKNNSYIVRPQIIKVESGVLNNEVKINGELK